MLFIINCILNFNNRLDKYDIQANATGVLQATEGTEGTLRAAASLGKWDSNIVR